MKRRPWPSVIALLAVGALLGTIMMANRFTTRVPPSPGPSPAALLSGSYLGWSSDTDSRLLLLGHGCRGSAADDTVVSLLLSGSQQRLLLPAHAVESFDSNLGPFGLNPVMLVDVSGGESWRFDRAVLRCRSGKEFAGSIGTVSVLGSRPNAAAVTLESTAQYASDQLFAELLIHNHSGGTLQLTSVKYAPLERATGDVRAAAGSYAQLPLWRSLVYDARLAPLDAAKVSPWDAAFQHPDDPRRLLPRSSHDLGLPVKPGEVAVIFLEQASLRTGRAAVPVMVFPVVDIVAASGQLQLAATEPLFTMSPVR